MKRPSTAFLRAPTDPTHPMVHRASAWLPGTDDGMKKIAASIFGIFLLMFGGGMSILSGFTLLSTSGPCTLGNCLVRADHHHWAALALGPGLATFVIGIALCYWALPNRSDE